MVPEQHDVPWSFTEAGAAVDLSPYLGADGRLIDPVDPGLGRQITCTESMQFGILPFALEQSALLVATLWPMRPDAEIPLRRLSDRHALHLVRTSEVVLRAAQERVFGDAARRPLGAILVGHGRATRDQVAQALALQAVVGGHIGQLLVDAGAVTDLDLARALAQQAGLPFRSLDPGARASGAAEAGLFDLLPEAFWTRHDAVPLARSGDGLVVAVADPYDRAGLDAMRNALRGQLSPVVAGRREIRAALDTHYGAERARRSHLGLDEQRPDVSARTPLSAGQTWAAALLAGVALLAFALDASLALVTASAALEAFFLVATGYRLWHMTRRIGQPAVPVDEKDIAALGGDLPVYTVLVPAYREAAVLPSLVAALTALDYPRDKLDIQLLLESDDDQTLAAARALRLPSFIDVVVVPPGGPRTKPRACNYGLQCARGDLLVIYDAEDVPEPDQLKRAVAAFRKLGPEVVALQCAVSCYNRDHNALTALFSAEYAAWFDLLLPSLHAARLPLPLGGNSTHFRIEALRRSGAWDPFNVAEDCDLGIRLARDGVRVGVIHSTTYEEATVEAVSWIRQRSRWLKGYMQTWLVHMRHPLRLWRELGTRGMLAFQMTVGGTALLALLNPVYWLCTSLWFATKAGFIQSLFPAWIFYFAMANFFFAGFVFTYASLIGLARRQDWALMRYALASPAYWTMMSVGAWKALLQLAGGQAYYWEKTEHGAAGRADAVDAEAADAKGEAMLG